MKFCPSCGTLILPQKKGDAVEYVCSKCDYSEVSGETKITSTVKEKKIEPVVTPTESADDQLPVCEITCEKCENKSCYYWDIQTRASDEPPTRFYKCTSCKHTWREYS